MTSLMMKLGEKLSIVRFKREILSHSDLLLAAVFLAVSLFPSPSFGQTDVWLGGAGSWSDASKWSAGVPTAASSVFIDNGNGPASVTVSGGYQCNTLSIDADAILTISGQPGFSHLDVYGTSVANAGNIVIDDTNGDAWLGFAAGQNVALTGGGTVTLNDTTGAAAAFISGDSSGATLTNVNNTIQGSGQLGFGNGLTLVNQASGVVNANQAGRVLYINPYAGVTNAGLMEATSAGSLNFSQGVTIDNAGGTISSSGSGSTVLLIGITQGGTLTTSGGGVMQGEGTLDGATHGILNNQGSFSVPGSHSTTLIGTINNTGTMVLDDTSGDSSLGIAASHNVMLTGAGTVTLNDTTGAVAAFISGGAGSTLTNVNNLIQGSGQIGQVGGLALLNKKTGVVSANQSGRVLYINANGGVTNQGLMEATSGGSLNISQGLTVNNAGGTISSSGSGSTVLLIDITQGGTLTTSGGGVMQVEGMLDGATHGAVNNHGIFSVPGGHSTTLIGTINNKGTMVLDDTSGDSSLGVAASHNVMLTGAGTVMLNDTTGAVAAFISGGAGSTLTNVNNKIQGSGQIGQAGGLALLNEKSGVVNANQAGRVLYINANGGATNQGLMEATNGGVLNLSTAVSNTNTIQTIGAGSQVIVPGTINNQGVFSVGSGTLFNITGTFPNFSGTTLTGGAYTVSGTLEFTGANIVNDAALLTLSRASAAIVDQSANDGLRDFAAITTIGSLTLASGKTLTTPASLSNAGQLTVGAGANLKVTGSYTQTAGATTVDGTLTAPSGVDIQAGSVLGKGKIASTVVSSGSFVAGDSPVKTGKLSSSTYTQNASGTLNIAIGGLAVGKQYGQLAVANGVSLNGTLDLTLIGSFVPAIENAFTILTCSACANQFATVNGLSINSGEHFEITYNPKNVTLTVVSGP